MNKIIMLAMISAIRIQAADVTVHLRQEEEKEEGPFKPNLVIDLNLIDGPIAESNETTVKDLNGDGFSYKKDQN